ncbi:hypothetical protein [Terrabacter sp. C0L_2]|uniref:hypothetical protein n=1 Tax=Terrabacter sp. C0L_2 TaxID=3108389 RepID=UPI002ED03AE5|nr:hypothetical protein U5C87_07085 [Terrabacter sp. C0L_2]
MTVLVTLRRAAPLLLVAGAVLLGAVLVWPAQHLVSRTGAGAEHLVGIWFDGRVRGVSEAISANGGSSPGRVALVAAAMVLLLTAAAAWVSWAGHETSARRGPHATRGPAAAAVVAAVLAAAATVVIAVVLARSEPASFGWASTREIGQLEFERTLVAFFVPAAAALGALAVVAMLVTLVRRRPTA